MWKSTALLVLGTLVSNAAQARPAACKSFPVIQQPCSDLHVSYSADVIVVSGGVACTLTDISRYVPDTALSKSAERVWDLKSSIRLEEGAQLRLVGAPLGGDVDQLRIHNSNLPEKPIHIAAQWGSIDIRSTHVLGWDDQLKGPSTSELVRPYIVARSFLDGVSPRESFMNIEDSEVSHLGYSAPEAQGLAWKVRGTGVSGSDSDVFAKVDVFGAVRRSFLHHMYTAVYTWGARCMEFKENEVANNLVYGLDPHDNSDQLIIVNNQVHDNGRHGIICSKRCDHLTIMGNNTYANGGSGIMVHQQVTNSIIEGNTSHHNGDAGIAVFDSHLNEVVNNHVSNNKIGIHVYMGSAQNLFSGNEVVGNRSGILFDQGGGVPLVGTERHPRNNTITHNVIRANAETGEQAGDAKLQTWKSNRVEP